MSSVRVLILGLLAQVPSAHGYEIRQEFEEWGTENWANVAYGSIYFALNKMAEEGLVERLNETEERQKTDRIEYKITEQGRSELRRMLSDYWWNWKPAVHPFMVAISYMNLMPKDELIAALKHRASYIKTMAFGMDWKVNLSLANVGTPRHVKAVVDLQADYFEAELKWIEQTIKDVENGDLP